MLLCCENFNSFSFVFPESFFPTLNGFMSSLLRPMLNTLGLDPFNFGEIVDRKYVRRYVVA